MSDTQVENKDVKDSNEKNINPLVTMDVPKFVSLDNLDNIKKNLDDGTIKDINVTDDKGNTVLHTNAAKGNLDIIKYLLEHEPPANVNKQNNDGDTPLNLAAFYGNLRAVKLLLKNEADTDIKNNKGLTPLESVIELKKQGNTSQDIEEVIKFLEKDKQGVTTLKDYYDTIPEEKVEENTEDDNAVYDDSKIDNDDDLENTDYNITWKNNKAKIKELYTVKGITQNLVNYGNNLILFYEKKISAVKELIERKSSDGKKNFVGDATIQDEQRKNIGDMLWNDPSTKKMTDDEKLALISGYYNEIGSQAEEIMEKDYNDRNRTIKYLLLIREYEANIESIQKAIDIKGAIQLESSTEVDVEGLFDISEFKWSGGSGKKIMRGGANPQLYGLYVLLVEEFKNAINSPINDAELKTYLIQYIDKLQFLIADPVNVDALQFKEACQELLDRINFLKQNQYGGKKGGAKTGLLGQITGSNDSDSEDEDDDPVFFGSHESENIERRDRDEEETREEVAAGYPNPALFSGNLNPENIVPKLTPDSPEAIDKFINSNNLLELENMLKDGEITNVDIKDSKGENAFLKIENQNKLWYLINKGADVNQKDKSGNTLLQRLVASKDDNSDIINKLIRLGASKNGIDPFKIPNEANKKTFDETFNTPEDIENSKKALASYIEDLLKQQAANPSSADPNATTPISSLDPSDPKHPLHGQWKALEDAKKKRDDDFTKWSDELKKLLDSSTKVVDEITKIKNGTLGGPQKYEDQKAAIEQVTKAQLDLIEAQTKACIDAYTKQTDDLNADLLKQKQLASQILTDIKGEENKDLLLANDNNLRDKENLSYSDKQLKNVDSIDDLLKSLLDVDVDLSNKNFKTESSHEMFVRKYISPNYVKKNLYEFINQCRLLDSVPEWRAKITTLMVGYLTSYVVDPNDKTKHISVIPSYDYFNLVLQGTPGVGKSYSSAIIGKALKWCGFLTVGKMKEIKKPDIVGSYTGQTAPKVYNELTQGLGNIVFIDEAYSIAGAKDETKGTFNEFGQEALDAITDYTSEHIGLLAFIVAGYEYEMQNQFLNVNIGLPRRFPTVLTLRRYDMKSFWKILEMPIIKFCPKYQVDHQHHACFELLNIMFNFQWTPNPVLQMSKKWPEWWEGYNLKNLIMNLKVNMLSNGEEIINIPFAKLSNFDEKIKNIENTNITATSIDVLPLTELIGGDINMETSTFIKAYFIYKFCNIRNGDFFRSQADNLTKFGQTILSDKIINPSGLFVPDQDKNKKGNTKWIEYIYFNLYFTKNPNKPVENINFSFETPTTTNGGGCGHDAVVSEHNGGSKIKQYTKKNIKVKKYTRRNNGKKNKNTKHKYQNKKNKNTIRQRGGVLDKDISTVMNYYLNARISNDDINRAFIKIYNYIKANPDKTSELRNLKNLVDKKFEQLTTYDYNGIKPENKKMYKEKLRDILTKIKDNANPPVEGDVNTSSEVPVEKEISATPPENDSTNTPVTTESPLPPPAIIKPDNLPPEIRDDFSTILNYYLEPSISESDLNTAYKNIFGKIDNQSIDELKYMYVLSALRFKQFSDPYFKSNPSKNLELITKDLNFIRTAVNRTLTKKDKTFKSDKLFEEANELLKDPSLLTNEGYQAYKSWPEFEKKLDLKENIPSQKESMSMKKAEKQQLELQQQAEIKQKQLEQEEIDKTRANMKNVTGEIGEGQLSSLKNINKDLVFDIERIDFSAFRDTQEITETIVRNKIIDNEINKKESSNEKLKTIFVTFMKKYDEYLTVFSNDTEMSLKQKKDLPIFIYTYLLLACYNTAFKESRVPLAKFSNDSWWFFTADDFKIIANYLDIEIIISNFNKLIGVEAEVTPEVKTTDKEKDEEKDEDKDK
jgi:ankyrin repeat protein